MGAVKVIEEAAKILRNERAGWVHRRDAAESLGAAAGRALCALHAHRQEQDVDVRKAVDEALAVASAGLQGVAPKVEEKAYSLEELVKACERSGKRSVEATDEGFAVLATLSGARTQTVQVREETRKDGERIIRAYTVCGPATAESRAWALRTNAKLTEGALAVETHAGEERLILVNNFIASETTPAELRATIKALAFYGDWIEQKLTALDAL